MFDIGFWELSVIGVVALLVIGPERLPKVARTAGLWFARIRNMIGSVKADVERELRADELKRIMEEQSKSSGVHEIIEETRESVGEAGRTLRQTREELERGEDREDEYLVRAQPKQNPPESESAPTESSDDKPRDERQ